MAAAAAGGAADANAQFQIDPERIRHYTAFLDGDHGAGPYRTKVLDMIKRKDTRLVISLDDLRRFDVAEGLDPPQTRQLVSRPMDHIPAFERALKDFVGSIQPDYVKTVDRARGEFRVGFEGSLVRPKVVRSVHYCEATNLFIQREYRDGTSTGAFGVTTSVYPTVDEAGNPLVTEYGMSTYRDHQTISIQEMPEKAPAGQLPRSVDVVMEEDLVDRVKPGDRVQIIGSYRAMPFKSQNSTSGLFRERIDWRGKRLANDRFGDGPSRSTVLLANNIRLLSKDATHLTVTEVDVQNIKRVARTKEVFELLSRSFAPSIFGHKEVKEALVLLLLGGVEKDLSTGTHIRGDINMLMVGDPSTAKSQILRFVMNAASLAVATTGRGATGVGLTAAVTSDKETGDRRLEAGAMVLADRGVVCIDEFDKMSDGDRVAMHEVMEQQTVTISKAGIHASLNARCSVVAAANPVYGQYNRQKKPTENIGLPDSLLSRFDLLFIVLDHMNPVHDREISTHVLRMHQFRKPGEEDGAPTVDTSVSLLEDQSMTVDPNATEEDTPVFQKVERVSITSAGAKKEKIKVLTFAFLRKYLYYAKTTVRPTLSKEAADIVSQAYASLRNRQDNKTLPVTARTLETLIRLSTAHAKARLSQIVTEEDAEAAEAIMRFALYNETQVEKKTRKKRVRMPDDRDGDEGTDEEDWDAAEEAMDTDGADASTASPKDGTTKRVRADPFDFGGAPAEPRTPQTARATRSSQLEASTEPEAPEPAAPAQVLSAERSAEFLTGMRDAFRAIRAETTPLDTLMEHINRGRAVPFSEADAELVLARLQDEGRVMYRDRIVFLI